ncbi:MAG: PepSY domain-containing protein, partial [Clostridiales bacterium]|nr:PepSY domain-containing protein [Clostridiales bacterium]
MKRIINTCFGTTKKAILSITCIAAATAALGGAAYASTTANTQTGNSVIGEALAQEYAFADAGIAAADAENIVTEYEYEDGQYIYDVEFTTDDTEFEYWIRAADGTIIRKSAGVIAGTAADSEADAGTGTDATAGTDSSEAAAGITLEDAQELALSDAEVAAEDATFTKAKEDIDDGAAVFDIEFYTSSTEYEYEIRVSDGAIVDRSQEAHKTGSSSSGSGSS